MKSFVLKYFDGKNMQTIKIVFAKINEFLDFLFLHENIWTIKNASYKKVFAKNNGHPIISVLTFFNNGMVKCGKVLTKNKWNFFRFLYENI